EEAFKVMEQTITYFELLPMPTLCVINGPAMGAGLELALACDMRIGSENTKLGIPVGNLGITLNNRFAHRLVSLLGPSKTKELVYMGKIYDGTQAHQHGLLNELVDSNDLNTHSLNMASRIASQSPRSLLAIKRAVAESTESAPELWEGTTNFVDPEDFPEGVSRDAKRAGIKVTAEVTPHHLVLDENDIKEKDPNFKMNPPLRGSDDRAALIEGLLDGTLDFIATDHAPHHEDEKAVGIEAAPFGIVGIENAFQLVYTKLVKTGVFTLQQVID